MYLVKLWLLFSLFFWASRTRLLRKGLQSCNKSGIKDIWNLFSTMTQRSTNKILCGLVLQFKTFKYDNVDRKVSSIWRSFYYDRASSDTENQTKLYQRISELLPPVSIQLHENKNIRWREVPTLTTLREAHEFKYSLKLFASTAAE